MAYPAAYGFIPGTLAADGDPADALVLTPAAVVPGAVIRARPIGMLQMEDESGQDEKIICVPHDKIHTLYKDVQSIDDLPEIVRASIEHFFTRYQGSGTGEVGEGDGVGRAGCGEGRDHAGAGGGEVGSECTGGRVEFRPPGIL